MATEMTKKKDATPTRSQEMVDQANAFSPDVDVYETDDSILFVADMPGVKKGDVQVEFDENNTLYLRGKCSYAEPEGRHLYRQFNLGNYYRAFTIYEDIDANKVSAQVDNGLLIVTVSKPEHTKPRRIQINA